MAPRLKCNLCEQPLVGHCPDSNPTCTWLRCRNDACSADVYDWHRGTLRHTDGRVEGWDEQPTSDQPPTITLEVEDDGGPAASDT